MTGAIRFITKIGYDDVNQDFKLPKFVFGFYCSTYTHPNGTIHIQFSTVQDNNIIFKCRLGIKCDLHRQYWKFWNLSVTELRRYIEKLVAIPSTISSWICMLKIIFRFLLNIVYDTSLYDHLNEKFLRILWKMFPSCMGSLLLWTSTIHQNVYMALTDQFHLSLHMFKIICRFSLGSMYRCSLKS